MAILRIRDENGQVHEIAALKGEKGADGYTPQKGVDYYTDAEKEALIAELGARDVDQELNEESSNAVANKVVTVELNRLWDDMSNTAYDFNVRINANEERLDGITTRLNDDIEPKLLGLENGVNYANEHIELVEQQLGDIETALDGILAIQESLIGGDTE